MTLGPKEIKFFKPVTTGDSKVTFLGTRFSSASARR